MRHPVYHFRLVLKELRHDAGLTVLAAAEATQYGNYERWESGETRVGPQHLRMRIVTRGGRPRSRLPISIISLVK